MTKTKDSHGSVKPGGEVATELECKCEVIGCYREAEVTRDGYVLEMCREHNREARNA